jgi:hypothetical protein
MRGEACDVFALLNKMEVAHQTPFTIEAAAQTLRAYSHTALAIGEELLAARRKMEMIHLSDSEVEQVVSTFLTQVVPSLDSSVRELTVAVAFQQPGVLPEHYAISVMSYSVDNGLRRLDGRTEDQVRTMCTYVLRQERSTRDITQLAAHVLKEAEWLPAGGVIYQGIAVAVQGASPTTSEMLAMQIAAAIFAHAVSAE